MLLDDTKVRKTSIYTRLCNGEFNPKIGVDFILKQLQVDGKQVKFQIWNASGDASYKSLLYFYFKSQKELFSILIQLTKKHLKTLRIGEKMLQNILQDSLNQNYRQLEQNQIQNKIVRYNLKRQKLMQIQLEHCTLKPRQRLINQNVDQAFTNILKVILYQEQTQ